jgi:hypothetical protein
MFKCGKLKLKLNKLKKTKGACSSPISMVQSDSWLTQGAKASTAIIAIACIFCNDSKIVLALLQGIFHSLQYLSRYRRCITTPLIQYLHCTYLGTKASTAVVAIAWDFWWRLTNVIAAWGYFTLAWKIQVQEMYNYSSNHNNKYFEYGPRRSVNISLYL